MQVYQTDARGVFIAKVTADPDPMQEGAWLIPAGCTHQPPPPIPAGHMAIWDGKAWSLTPTPKGEDDPAPTLPPTPEQIKAQTVLSKTAFCMALFKAGILPKSDAAEAARGKWPTQFEAALAGMSEEAQLAAMLAWSETTHITRMASMFLSLLTFYGGLKKLTPAQTAAFGDQIFGITP